MKPRDATSFFGVEGALMALAPLPLLFPFTQKGNAFPDLWLLVVASLAAIACLTCASTFLRWPMVGKMMGSAAAGGTYAAAFPYMASSPFAALAGSVTLISVLLTITDFKITPPSQNSNAIERRLQRAWWSLLVTPLIIIVNIALGTSDRLSAVYVMALISIISQALVIHWILVKKVKYKLFFPLSGITIIGFAFYYSQTRLMPNLVILFSLIHLIILPRNSFDLKKFTWEFMLSHPARLLSTTFLGLCVAGTVLLLLPFATSTSDITLVDAIFTSVSAVCVTGLTVLDTSQAFTLFGQFFILLLIQLGGLGIMSITTVALHAMGRRLSMKHERVLTSMTDTLYKDPTQSMIIILKFTFIIEGIGVFLLTSLFYLAGDPLTNALWRGTFTSISAFCNAGFALQSNSLIPYQGHPLALNVIAILIILGGIAPATSLFIPKLLTRKPVPISERIALLTTLILLISGTVFFMAFEWNNALVGLPFGDKIQNAWFQSVTLRTAGFNSIDIARVANPTFLVMCFFMFIGGSPGGTAGGIKTTTIGILALTFWANITGCNDVVIQNRRILSSTIYRAITIIASGIIFWFVIVLMLEATQQISARDIVFEATSAIGTVGLSTGATALLDEIGKIIIIIAMFGGRIGPITLFMLLSDEQPKSVSKDPSVKIALT